MRPIDADALEKKLHDAIDVGRRADVSTAELEAVLADVENMPTLPGPALPESVKTFASCTSCIHAADSEEICILRRCVHAIAEIKECYEQKQPERMRGTWIIKDNPGTGWYRVTCSECGEDVTSTAPCIGFYPNAKVTWDYCPNCGADMREVDDERV